MINGEEIKAPGRCHMCANGRMISANGGWSFPACYHPPYNGKWCAEIKDCPKHATRAEAEAAKGEKQ